MSYPLTREVFELFTKPYRQTAEITLNGVSESVKLTEKNLRQGGLVVTKSSASGDKVEIGSAICSELTLVLDNRDGRFDSVKFEGAELFVRVGIKKWDAHRWEKAVIHYVPLGYFTVDESPRKLSEITLSALDRMAQFDKSADLSEISFPTSLYELVSRACEVCRVPLGTKSAEMLNADYSVTAAPENSDGLTWRQIIQKAAEISGSCAYIDREGQLRFGWYKEPGGYCPPITPADRFSSDLYENEITITGVAVEDDENIYLAGSEGCELTVSENFLIRHDHAAIAKSIREKIGGFSYKPFSAQIKSLPHYDPLDILSFVDKSGEAHRVIVTDASFTLNGAASLEGRGETETSSGYAALDPLTQREREILSKMEKRQQRDITSREQALIELNNTIWNSLGLYATAEDSPNGGKVWYYHDAETLETSTIIYTFRAGGFAWTNKWEGDKTVWRYGFTRDGNAIVNALSAYKIQAEQIEAGAVTAEKISVEYKNSVEEGINSGLGEVRQEFKAADGELLSSISKEISEAETRLSSKIEQTADSITAEVTRATNAEAELSGKIELTAESLTATFESKVKEEADRAEAAEKELSSSITQTAESLTSTFTATITETAETLTEKIDEESARAGKAEETLTSTISQTAERISAEISRATEAEGELSSRITQTADSITAEVTRATNAESGLSTKITQTVNAIRLSVSSKTSGNETQTTVSITNGTTTLNSVTITGTTEKQAAAIVADSISGISLSYSSSSANNQTTSVLTLKNGSATLGTATVVGTTASQAATIAADAVKGITLTVSNSTTGASSTLTLKSGSTTLSSGTIEFKGLVTFSNLTDGKTQISGDNITTGTISAERIDVSSIYMDRLYSNVGGRKVVVDTYTNTGGNAAIIIGGNGSTTNGNVLATGILASQYVYIGYTRYNGTYGNNLVFDTSNRSVFPNGTGTYSWSLGSSTKPFSNFYTVTANIGSNASTSRIGFFGATPQAKKTGISTLDGLITALKNYGLIG